MAKHRLNKLTKDQRKALYERSDANAGAGWNATGVYEERRHNRYPNRERDTTKPVDEELV
jgi:hypothetical protein